MRINKHFDYLNLKKIIGCVLIISVTKSIAHATKLIIFMDSLI